MPSLADIIAASAANGDSLGRYTNKDLTPAARRLTNPAGLPVDLGPQADPTLPSSGQAPYVAPDGGRAEQDRLLDEAKGALSKYGSPGTNELPAIEPTDPLQKMLGQTGRLAASGTPRIEDSFGEGAARSLGDTAVGVYKGARQIPGDILGGILGLPGAIVEGYEQLPEGLKAIIDPATWRGIPDAAKQQFTALANDPETATRIFGGMIAAGPAGELAESAALGAPGAAGGAISKLGRGMQAVGQSPILEGTGVFRKAGAVLHPGVGTVLAAVGPEALSAAGRAVEGFGGKVANVGQSPALQALKKLAGTDLKEAFTPAPTADELAAGSVRATVDAAKGMVDKGMSRGQAAQRAGWPLAGDFELNEFGQPVNKYGVGDFGTHPGQNVEAHRPYEPTVRGQAGNVIREGRGGPGNTRGGGSMDESLDNYRRSRGVSADKIDVTGDEKGSLRDFLNETPDVSEEDLAGVGAAPSPQAQAVLDGLRRNTTAAPATKNPFAPLKKAVQAVGGLDDLAASPAVKAMKAGGSSREPEVDLSNEAGLSVLDRLARLSRSRALSHSFRTNTALAEGY